VLGTRWLTEEEEEERIAKASTAGAKSVVSFLQKGHRFEMKADIPMSTQQREEARKKRIKDEEDAVMMKKSAALLGKPPSKKKGKQLALSSKPGCRPLAGNCTEASQNTLRLTLILFFASPLRAQMESLALPVAWAIAACTAVIFVRRRSISTSAAPRNLLELERLLNSFKPVLKDDVVAIRSLQMALSAAKKGTYGVGAVIVSSQGELVCEGHNHVHIDGFHSDLHAEMVVLNDFERGDNNGGASPGELTLVSTLEPCPMCMTRLIFAGIGTIKYVCPDDIGGMVQRHRSLPPVFRSITADQRQEWIIADCSPLLRTLAYEIWASSQAMLDQKVVDRAAGK
jgi:tRNA(Arg) A34 adenosine deaminase TadA